MMGYRYSQEVSRPAPAHHSIQGLACRHAEGRTSMDKVKGYKKSFVWASPGLAIVSV